MNPITATCVFCTSALFFLTVVIYSTSLVDAEKERAMIACASAPGKEVVRYAFPPRAECRIKEPGK